MICLKDIKESLDTNYTTIKNGIERIQTQTKPNRNQGYNGNRNKTHYHNNGNRFQGGTNQANTGNNRQNWNGFQNNNAQTQSQGNRDMSSSRVGAGQQ